MVTLSDITEMLMSLSIPTLVETTMPAKPAPRPKRKAASRAKKEFEKEPKMRRRSLRNKGLAPDGETEVHKAQIERLEQVYSAPTRDAGPLAWADTVVEKYHDLEDEEEKKHFDCIADATTSWVSGRKAAQEAKYGSGEGKTSKSASVKEEKTKSGTRGRKKVKQEGEGEGDIDLEERCVWSSDHIRSLVVGTSSVKCTKERITSMAYHPSSTAETSLVAVGDKKGGLGLFRHSTE